MATAAVEENKTLKKYNPEIGLTLKNGSLNFVSRKLYNVLAYHAQRLGKDRKGVLPDKCEWDISTLPKGFALQNFFWMPMGELIGDASTRKNKQKVVQDFLEKMTEITVTRREAGRYGQFDRILGGIRFLNSRDVGAGGQERWLVGWNFADIEELILDPNSYTTINLYYQSQFKTEQTLILYEIARRYATHEKNDYTTYRDTWEHWQEVLAGNKKPREEYKLFKRDFIKPSIDEINRISDITVELKEHRIDSRAVNYLSFKVTLKVQPGLDFQPGPVINIKLINDLVAAGVAEDVAPQLVGKHGDECCQKNLNLFLSSDHAREAGWLVTAIRADYAGAAEKTRAEKAKQATSKRVLLENKQQQNINKIAENAVPSLQTDVEIRAEREVKRKTFDALPFEEQNHLIETYLATLKGRVERDARATLTRPDWLTHGKDEKPFLAWFAKRLDV